MAAFTLTAKLVLLPPSNVADVVRLLNSKLGSVQTKVDIKVSQKTLSSLDALNKRVQLTDQAIRSATARLSAFESSFEKIRQSANKASNSVASFNRGGGAGRGGSSVGGFSFSSPPNMGRSIGEIQRMSQETAKLARITKTAGDAVEQFGHQAQLSLRRFSAFSLAAGSMIQLTKAITAGLQHVVEYDRQMVKLAQVLGSSRDGVRALDDEISRLSTSLGVSSTKIADIALTFAQAGLSIKDTKAAIEVLAKTELAPTFDNIKNSTEAAIAVLQQFGGGVRNLSKDFSQLNTISAKFAVESSDLTTAISKAGGVFQSAGSSALELMALFTAVRQTTRESADSIATGFRTIFARLQRPQTQDFLKSIGIDLKDAEGQFVGPYKAIERISYALKELRSTDPRFAKIVEEIGGYRQISRVIPLIQQFDVAQRAMLEGMLAGDSLTADAAKAQQSLAVQLTKVREEFLATMRVFSQDTTIQNITNGILKLASAFNYVLASLKPLLPAIASLGAMAVGPPILRGLRAFTGGRKFAQGGVVPGSGNGDTVPAMLTPGEFVVKKSSAKAIGYDRLAEMNRYSTGGPVYSTRLLNERPERYHTTKKLARARQKMINTFGINPNMFVSGTTFADEMYAATTVDGQTSLRRGYGYFNPKTKEMGYSGQAGTRTIYEEYFHAMDAAMAKKGDTYSSSGKDVRARQNIGGVNVLGSIGRNPAAAIANLYNSEDDMKFIARVTGRKLDRQYLSSPTERFAKLMSIIMDGGYGKIKQYDPDKAERLKFLARQFRDDVRAKHQDMVRPGDGLALSAFGKVRPKYPREVWDYLQTPPTIRTSKVTSGSLNLTKGWDAFGTREGKRGLALGGIGSLMGILLASYAAGYAGGGKVTNPMGGGYLRSANKIKKIANMNIGDLSLFDEGSMLVSGSVDSMVGDYQPMAKYSRRLINSRLGIDPKEYIKYMIGLKNLSGDATSGASTFGASINGAFAARSKNLYFNTSNPGNMVSTFLEEMLHGLDNMGIRGFHSERNHGAFGKFANELGDSDDVLERLYMLDGGKNFNDSHRTYYGMASERFAKGAKGLINPRTAGKFKLLFGSKKTSGLESILDEVKQEVNILRLLTGKTKRFASGGGVPGEGNRDTVPALLTPGEFVINKKSAQMIGHSTLNRMNKFARYATGGSVQKGSLGGVGLGGVSLGGLAAGAFYAAPLLQEPIDKLGKRLLNLDNSFETLIKVVSAAAIQFLVISRLTKTATMSFLGKGLDYQRTPSRYNPTGNRIDVNRSGDQITRGVRAFNSERTSAIITSERLAAGKRKTDSRATQLSMERANEFMRRRDALRTQIDEMEAARTVKLKKPELESPSSRYPYGRVITTKQKPRSQELKNLIDEYQNAQPVAETAEERGLKRRGAIFDAAKNRNAAKLTELPTYQASLKTAKSLDKMSRAVDTVNNTIAGLAVAALAASAIFDDQARKAREAGDINKGRRLATTGGGLSGAATGGSIGAGIGGVLGTVVGTVAGSFAGGVGAIPGGAIGGAAGSALGGLIGGGIGYAFGSSAAQKQYDQDTLAQKYEKLTEPQMRSLNYEIGRKDFRGEAARGFTSSLISTRQEQLEKMDDKEGVRSLISGDLPAISDYLGRAAEEAGKNARSTKDVNAELAKYKMRNKDIIAYYAKFTNQTLKAVEERFQDIIETTSKEIQYNERAAQAANELASRISSVNRVISAIGRVADSLRAFEYSISNIAESVSGTIGGVQYRERADLQNPDGLNAEGLRTALGGLPSLMGMFGQERANEVVQAQDVFNQLPSILNELVNSGDINDDNKIASAFDKFGKDNPFTKDIAENIISELSVGDRDSKIRDIKRDPNSFAGGIAGGIENLIKPFQEAEKALNAELTKYSAGLALRRQIEYKYIDMLNAAIDMRSQKEMDMAQALDRDVDFGQIRGNIAKQLENILPTRADGTKAKTLDEIEAGLVISRKDQKAFDAVSGAGTGMDANRRKVNELARDRATEDYERSKKALEFIASGKEIGAIKGELDRTRSRRETTKGFFREYAFSDNDGRRNMQRSVASARVIARTGNANSVSGANRQAAGEIFERFRDVRLDAFGGKTGKEVQDEVTAQEMRRQGFSEKDIKSVVEATPEEEKLIKALGEAYDNAIRAQEILAQDLKENQDDLVNKLDASFSKFLEEMAKIFTKEEKVQTDEKDAVTGRKKAQLEERKKARENFFGNGKNLTDDDIANLNRTRDARGRLAELNDKMVQGNKIALDATSGSFDAQAYKDYVGEDVYKETIKEVKTGKGTWTQFDQSRVKEEIAKKQKQIAQEQGQIMTENKDAFSDIGPTSGGTDEYNKFYKRFDAAAQGPSNADIKAQEDELNRDTKANEERKKRIEGQQVSAPPRIPSGRGLPIAPPVPGDVLASNEFRSSSTMNLSSPQDATNRNGRMAANGTASDNPMAGLDKSIGTFLTGVNTLTEAMNNFPRTVSIEGNINTEVVINGASVLKELEPGLAKLVSRAINDSFSSKSKQEKLA